MADRLVQLIWSCRHTPDSARSWDIVLEILKELNPKLRLFILGSCPLSAWEDVYQETVRAVAVGVFDFRGQTDKELRSWCFGVAHNKIKDHFRKTGRQEQLDPEELQKRIDSTAEDRHIAEEERRHLKDALELVGNAKAPCVGYLWSRHVVELSFEEMAHVYGGTPDALRMQTSRCLELAKKLVREESRTYVRG